MGNGEEKVAEDKVKTKSGSKGESDTGGIEVEIHIDGDVIGLNRFVQGLMGNMISGAISALKGVRSDWKEIEITVKRARVKNERCNR